MYETANCGNIRWLFKATKFYCGNIYVHDLRFLLNFHNSLRKFFSYFLVFSSRTEQNRFVLFPVLNSLAEKRWSVSLIKIAIFDLQN